MEKWANIDLESSSAVDLTAVGAHVYAEDPTTHILCLGYKVCGGPTQLWWPGQPFPQDLARVILAGGRIEAFNAAFERVMWPLFVKHHGAPPIQLKQWRCTMVRAFLQGFPGKLEWAGPSMGLGVCKDAEGHKIMLQLCKPRQRWALGKKGYQDAVAKVDGDEYQMLPDSEVVRWWRDPDKLARLGQYCMTDVDTEAAASAFLFPMPEVEVRGWQLDQRINDRGFYVDKQLVARAMSLMKPAIDRANARLIKVTAGRLRSVTKPNEIRAWINERLGLALDSISKHILNDILVTQKDTLPADVKTVINLRLSAAKTSTAKLRSLMLGMMQDGRFRGGLQYAGAGRTNRWAGRRFQPQNIPRPEKWALFAVDCVLDMDVEQLELLFDSCLEVISNILRSCITAAPGNELHFADFNAIEARITAWLCGAEKILDAYRTGKDPYRMMAAKVFGIDDWETIGKDSFERFLGKQIILGCGYGMGDRKFRGECKKLGVYISQDLATRSVATYREDNDEVPRGWKDLEFACQRAMQNPHTPCPALRGRVHYYYDGGQWLHVQLPSGRLLSYHHPRMVDDFTPWGKPCKKFQFWGWNSEKARMEWQEMYGGKWMENIVQAFARDVMLDAMLRLDDDGWNMILTVHDEVGSEEVKGARDKARMAWIMEQSPHFAPDLPLAVEGWTGLRYRK